MSKPLNEWSLNQWLQDLEQRHVQEIQLGLTRISSVAQKLNLNKPQCKVITVAGTNGKGSTVSALEAIYHAAGYRVGTYTSPHLIHFNERIRVNLVPIDDEELCLAFALIEEAREEVNLTYFEMVTLAALFYFKQCNLDVMILEVGLGGRLDATNIIDADLAIITTIDYDHQDFLGNTLEAIGYEKAGILRKGKPFIYADNNPPESILKVANELAVCCYLYGEEFSFQTEESHWRLNYLDKTIIDLPKPRIQLKSASAAILASLLLTADLPVSQEHIKEAMSTVFIPGRLQHHTQNGISILYDASHNPQSVRLLAETIKTITNKKTVHGVFSALKDKDLFGLISPLKDCIDRWYPAQLDNKRAASADTLLSVLRDAEISAEVCYTSPLVAFETAISQARSGDLVVVFGSFFTVGHVMAVQHNLLEPKEIL